MIIEIEQEISDIDWFFTDGKNVGFVASGGGELPLSISKSPKNIENLAAYFRKLPKKCEAIINLDLNKIFSASELDERYLSDFVEMAEKGFYTFDKTILNNYSDLNYHLVTIPTEPINIIDLSPEIVKILAETKMAGEISQGFSINSF